MLLVAGGGGHNGYLDTTEVLFTLAASQWTFKAPLPYKAGQFGSVTHNNMIFITGIKLSISHLLIENFPYALHHVFVLGGVGEGNTGHKSILQYDAGADRWEEVGSMQVARSYHAIAVTDTANLPCDCQAQLPGDIQISSK